MANASTELCGACCKGCQPIRKRFCESIVCACGAAFFSQIVVESNLPTNRRCRIEIPWEFLEDHGSELPDKTVTLQEKEDGEIHRVKIGGNQYVGYGLEWRDFAQTHNIGIGQVVVFTLVTTGRFLLQIYKLGNPSSIATNGQARTVVPLPVTPNVQGDDDIEVSVAQDWMAAKASRMNAANLLPSKVKVEKIFSETSSAQDTQAFDVTINGRQKDGIVPNDLEGMDVSDDIVEASDSSRRKKKFDSERFREGHSLRVTTRRALRYEHSELKTPAEDQGDQASPQASTRESSSDSEENGNSDASSSSTSDCAWSPRKSHSHRGRKRNAANFAEYNDSTAEDEDEDEDEDNEDGEDGEEDDQVLNKIAGKKCSSANGSGSSLDKIKRKRGRPSMRTGLASSDDEMNETRAGLLVEGNIVKKRGHDWHAPGTKRGRTYVSKRRPVTESEKAKTLEKAQKVQLKFPSFSKQLHKDSCYRSVILFAPTQFYRESMVSSAKGSYKAALVDEEGKSWPTNIRGMRIFWKNFTLDHYLEEDDVVVFELVDPRPESVKFLVHIFRVVDVKVTLTGKAGWAVHYNVVEGTKKQYFEERRRLLQAQGLKKLQKKKQKQKRKNGSSSPDIDTEVTEFPTEKKKQPSIVIEVYKRASTSQGESRRLQTEKHASNSPIADRLEDQHRSPWGRPTMRDRSSEMNRSSGELNNTSPRKRVDSVKQEMEDAPPLETAGGTLFGNAVNSVNIKSVLRNGVWKRGF